MNGPSPTLDVFTHPTELSEELLQGLANSLTMDFSELVEIREQYLSLLDLPEEARVLDLGCGTGRVGRYLARREGFQGTVVGVDLSPYFIDIANKQAAEEGIAASASFRVGNAISLPFANEHFHAILMQQFLVHAENPTAVLFEARRVLRPGGTLIISDVDHAATSLQQDANDQGGYELADAYMRHYIQNPYIMRQITVLCRQVGLDVVKVLAHPHTEIGQGAFLLSVAQWGGRALAEQDGEDADQVRRWLEDLERRHFMGVFYGSQIAYSYLVRRPV
ncbi:MAG: methyltransferase domain-containing protein [Chloroflexi bacterium]|nr:methyltransferase domain-containing protein [Chloroflexota bacterium]